jgi:hypothetical protein
VLDRGYAANFYEKALFVKPTWRPLRGVNAICSARRALCFYSHSRGALFFGGSVHRMRSVFSSQRRCNLLSDLSS